MRSRRSICDSCWVGCCIHHHHHFICPIIQQYAHLREYDSRRAGQQGPTRTLTAAPKTFNKNILHEVTTLRRYTNLFIIIIIIYPRDAILALVLAMALCLSVTSRCSIETAERIELGFGKEASFHLSYTVLKKIRVSPKISVLSFLWNFVTNFGLRKFRYSISIVETCYQLSSTMVDAQSVINWSTKLTILSTASLSR